MHFFVGKIFLNTVVQYLTNFYDLLSLSSNTEFYMLRCTPHQIKTCWQSRFSHLKWSHKTLKNIFYTFLDFIYFHLSQFLILLWQFSHYLLLCWVLYFINLIINVICCYFFICLYILLSINLFQRFLNGLCTNGML